VSDLRHSRSGSEDLEFIARALAKYDTKGVPFM
jgi:hypothetical protein